jgi:hypothetical protein
MRLYVRRAEGDPSGAIWIAGPCSVEAIACSQGQAGPTGSREVMDT